MITIALGSFPTPYLSPLRFTLRTPRYPDNERLHGTGRRILRTLPSLITNFSAMNGRLLANVVVWSRISRRGANRWVCPLLQTAQTKDGSRIVYRCGDSTTTLHVRGRQGRRARVDHSPRWEDPDTGSLRA